VGGRDQNPLPIKHAAKVSRLQGRLGADVDLALVANRARPGQLDAPPKLANLNFAIGYVSASTGWLGPML
jgi:hypothetical protein